MKSTELLSPLALAIIAEASADRVSVKELAYRVGVDAERVQNCVQGLVERGILDLTGQVLATDLRTFERAVRSFA